MMNWIKVFFSRRMFSVFLLGIYSGLPLLLIGSTLKAWMKEANVDLTLIGIYALTGVPYTLKFLWAPFMDRYVPPILGRRRGWIVICQIFLAAGFVAMGFVRPDIDTWTLAALAFFIAFFSASQDIVIDAYRREVLADAELGLGSSLAVNGYRVGMLVAGALALALADHISWSWVYIAMGGIMLSGLIVTVFSPEPSERILPPRNLTEAVVQPFLEYFKRPRAIEVLVFILLFKIGDSMASDMFTPFYLDVGYTKTEIAAIAKLFGFWATIGGGLLGGVIIVKIGVQRALWLFGILQTISTSGFILLARLGKDLPALTEIVVVENVCTAMATTAYIGFMASLCNKRFTATQYALLSSLTGVPRVILGSSSGYLAKSLGWEYYFLFCALLHIPGLLMLLRQSEWEKTKPVDA